MESAPAVSFLIRVGKPGPNVFTVYGEWHQAKTYGAPQCIHPQCGWIVT